jgi:hypothetical protein
VLSLWQKLLLLLLLLRGALCRARCISDLRKKASSPVSPDDDQSQLAPGTASPKEINLQAAANIIVVMFDAKV